jgi:3-methyladenine DNA glycosylase AlkD
MNAKELHNKIKEFCIKNADEVIVIKYSRYFKGGYTGYGLHKDLIPNKVKEIKKESWCTIDLVYEVSKLLIPEDKFELPSFAVNLLNEFSKEFDSRTFQELDSWFSLGINNWAHTDEIVQYFFPVFWKKEIIKLDDLSEWRTAKNKFQRRCVPVAMIKYLKHSADLAIMFNFIDSMMMDSEREVHQGLGWFLRECRKKDRALTETFLMKWKNDCARLIIQYATEKMTKEERLKFRRDNK